ncbi:MAG: hypothetical protein ACI8XO_001037 [Verrucomicrobiales bacterium]
MGEEVETRIENEWQIGSIGVVDRYGSGPWTYRSAKAGDGILVRLFEYRHW